MRFSIVLTDWPSAREQAQPLRIAVFVQEQGVPEDMEWDEMDAVSVHAVAMDENDRPIGTGRLLPDGHIGRMAVALDRRGKGVGSAILMALMDAAATRGDRSVLLHAQRHAESFYQRHGFSAVGEPFDEAGIAHICMRCVFPPRRS